MAKVLVFRANYDMASSYMNHWMGGVIEYARSRGYEVIDLSGPVAVLDNFIAAMGQNPEIVVMGVHGLPERVAGDLDSPLLNSCDENEKLLAEKSVVYGTCLAGQVLARTTREKGALFVLGYIYEFTWPIDPKTPSPEMDEVARPFGELYTLPIKLLLDGLPPKEIYSKTTEEYGKVYRELSQSPYIGAAFSTTALENNRAGLIIYGEEGLVLAAPPPSMWPVYLLAGAAVVAGTALYLRRKRRT